MTHTLVADILVRKKVIDFCVTQAKMVAFSAAHTEAAFRSCVGSVLLYPSGKVVIQGGDITVLVKSIHQYIDQDLRQQNVTWAQTHVGMDETGRGDLFGPLVTAAVIAGADEISDFVTWGVRDSKDMGMADIRNCATRIKAHANVVWSIYVDPVEEYNFRIGRSTENMNYELARCHAQSLAGCLSKKFVPWGLLDKFAGDELIQENIRFPAFELRCETKAERDPVVAAASILARDAQLTAWAELEKRVGIALPLGCNEVTHVALRKLYEKGGMTLLNISTKLNFSTVNEELNMNWITRGTSAAKLQALIGLSSLRPRRKSRILH